MARSSQDRYEYERPGGGRDREVARCSISDLGDAALLTRRQLAAILNRSVFTLNDWAAKRRGPRQINVGGRPMYRWGDVQAYLNAQTQGTDDQPLKGGAAC